MRAFVVLAAALATLPSIAMSQPSASEILRRIDANMTFRSAIGRARMTITYRSGDVRTLEFRSWSEGADRSFLEFTAPAREAGSRFLRLEDNMWIFLPTVGKSVRIQGHMLRQGLMGSDFSYGDASERPSMEEDYDASVAGRDSVAGRPTIVLSLVARRDDLAYPGRKIWVDAERWIPLREERFAKSGKLLKTANLSDVRRVADRWYPFSVELDDALQRDTSTKVEFLELQLGASMPPDIFTLRHLEQAR